MALVRGGVIGSVTTCAPMMVDRIAGKCVTRTWLCTWEGHQGGYQMHARCAMALRCAAVLLCELLVGLGEGALQDNLGVALVSVPG